MVFARPLAATTYGLISGANEESRAQRLLCESKLTAMLDAMQFTSRKPAKGAPYLEVVAPDFSSTAYDTIYGEVPAGPARPGEEGDLGRLVMDLSAAGIPTTENTFALRIEGDSMSGAGINNGDILILERREPRHGDIVAA